MRKSFLLSSNFGCFNLGTLRWIAFSFALWTGFSFFRAGSNRFVSFAPESSLRGCCELLFFFLFFFHFTDFCWTTSPSLPSSGSSPSILEKIGREVLKKWNVIRSRPRIYRPKQSNRNLTYLLQQVFRSRNRVPLLPLLLPEEERNEPLCRR